MKNKITTLFISFSLILSVSPVQVFAQEVNSSSYFYETQTSSGYDFYSPNTSSYNYVSPTVSSYDYTSPNTSSYNYVSPTVSSYNYTSPNTSSYNYVSPTVSSYDYTSPNTSSYNYVSPTVSSYDYTSPNTSSYNYVSPTVSSYDYTSPNTSSYNYVSPTVSSYNYTSPNTSSYNYVSPTVSNYNYSSPVTSSNNVTTTSNSQTNYSSPVSTYSNSTYTSPVYNSPVTTTTTITCPSGSRLINGQCLSTVTGNVITTTSCPAGTVVSGTDCLNTINGAVVTRIVCTTGTLTNGQCVNTVAGDLVTNITCPTGSTLTNGKCVNTITGTIVTNITCPTGANLVNGQCVNTITGSVVTNVICPSGSNNINGQCITTVTPPVTTVTNCPSNTTFVNGTCQQIINPPVVVNQTCWDGSVIPATSICAPQYKVCANGVSVPATQACYVPPTPVYVPKQVIKFNNVVTSLATQVTNTSGRCNGIGLIANNAQSTGWFEYGETTNLGRTTASAQIGSSDTAPFSNVLANLKPSTKYYCRAVMQNQFGIVKGEIVSFTTTAKATTYVKPVAVTKKPVVKTPVKTNTITCSDGTTVQTKNQTSATLLSQGEKLISLQIEKVSGKLTAGDSVTYKVNYKNLIDARLSGIVVKIALPQEIVFASTTVGTFDEGTRTLTLSQNTIDPYTEGTILISGTIAKNAPIGKTIITNAYVAYTVPGTNTQDEVTAYVIGSIVPNTEISKSDTGAKNVIGQNVGKGFMPSTLIEWLALLAIVFIIFILGRSVYASYKDDTQTPAHH